MQDQDTTSQSVYIYRTCQECGKAFSILRSQTTRGRGSFCSRVCARAFRVVDDRAFWAKVDQPDTGCWTWTGYRQPPMGYGQASCRKQNWLTHRLAYTLTYGPIPAGLWVLHDCDNPPCCHPLHLFLGTAGDNMRDCQIKGRIATGAQNGANVHPERHPRGEKQWRAMFTEDDVRDIRLQRSIGTPLVALATKYGCALTTISAIAHRVNWKHVL